MKSPYNKIALLVYCISFFLPVFKNDSFKGYEAFVYVTTYFTQPVLLICWLANVGFIITLFIPPVGWKRFFFAFATLVFSFGLMAYRYIPGTGSDHMDRKGTIALYGIGYILWIAAFAIIFLGSVIDLNKKTSEKTHGYS